MNPIHNGQLCREWTWHRLGNGQPILEFLMADPVPLFLQVTLHVAGERDRSTKAQRSQLEKVQRELAQ
jgi:hypothetical protein